MRTAAYCVLGLFAFTLLLIWLRTQLRYRIGTRSLRVTLFGLSVRRIALVDIRYISKRRPRWGENWWNTLRPAHRVLTIQRQSGWFKTSSLLPRTATFSKPNWRRPFSVPKPRRKRASKNPPVIPKAFRTQSSRRATEQNAISRLSSRATLVA